MMTWIDTLPFFGSGPTHRRTSMLDRLALHRQRQSLAQLDDRLLADIGLTRDQAQAESMRSLWDAPDHWTK